jgi:hypothetical protein
MQLPFCKICGEHHRLGHCPEWDEPPKVEHAKTNRTETPAGFIEEERPATVAQDQGGPGGTATETQCPAPKLKFDRTAYQRELMRKRRARAQLEA